MAEPLRIGIVGPGMIARVIAQAIKDSDAAILAAVSSRDLSKAEDLAAECSSETGPARAFDNWQAMLDWPQIDAVYVATPTAVKEEIARAAATAGKHVLADKPFASLASLQTITTACRSSDLAFMDATHFVHHPRTGEIKRGMVERIGQPQVVRTAFFFPLLDRDNIRFDQHLEPTGAVGDMAWYSMRAVVEYLPADTPLETVVTHVQRDTQTGAVIRAAGLLVFGDGTSSTWDVGYNAGVCIMDLDILGSDGMISLDDFVLDWARGFAFDNPQHRVGYTLRSGLATPADYQYIATPAPVPQHVQMIEDFAGLVHAPGSDARESSIEASERTQQLLDAVWAAAAG